MRLIRTTSGFKPEMRFIPASGGIRIGRLETNVFDSHGLSYQIRGRRARGKIACPRRAGFIFTIFIQKLDIMSNHDNISRGNHKEVYP